MITFSHPGVLALPSRLWYVATSGHALLLRLVVHVALCPLPSHGSRVPRMETVLLEWPFREEALGSSVWKKRKGVQRKARSRSVDPSREVVSFSPDHLSQDLGFLYSTSSSQFNLTPQSWLTPFSCCLALKCYFLPSVFEVCSTQCISEMCWPLILSLACDMGDLGRESWTCS